MSMRALILAVTGFVISVAACSSSESKVFEVDPTPAPVASVAVIVPPSLTAGQTARATAVTKDASGATLSGRAVKWVTSSESCARAYRKHIGLDQSFLDPDRSNCTGHSDATRWHRSAADWAYDRLAKFQFGNCVSLPGGRRHGRQFRHCDDHRLQRGSRRVGNRERQRSRPDSGRIGFGLSNVVEPSRRRDGSTLGHHA